MNERAARVEEIRVWAASQGLTDPRGHPVPQLLEIVDALSARLSALDHVAEAARENMRWQPTTTERFLRHLHPQHRAAILALRDALARLDAT